MEFAKLNIGIGTLESEKLKAKKVKVLSINVSKPTDKEGKVLKGKNGQDLSDKITLIAKHPDKEEPFELSKTRFLKVDKITESGLWFVLDKNNQISKNSAAAETMRKYNCNVLSDFEGKEIETIEGEGGYLCVKAY